MFTAVNKLHTQVTAGILADVTCDKVTVLNKFQIIFNANKMFAIFHKGKYRKRKMAAMNTRVYCFYGL